MSACVAVKPVEQAEQTSLLFIDGTVQSVSGNEIVLLLKLPEIKKTPDSPISEIAQQVIQKSLFLEGIKTEITNIPAVIKEMRGNTIIAILERPHAFAVGSSVKLPIPKKTIAIVDFEVIKGREKEAGRVTLEGLTSVLIGSGHFIVVERTKLKTIIDELQLSLSGLTKEPPEKVIGRLMVADLILTGTLAEVGGIWDINIRLVNVKTGQAMAAIAMRTPLFKPVELRDAGALSEDFERDAIDPSWILGYKKSDKSTYMRDIDRNVGADGSKSSARIVFDFPEGTEFTYAKIENYKKRDASLYNGLEFWAKATEKLTGMVSIFISMPDASNKMDEWIGHFQISEEWQKIRIPFEEIRISRGWIKKYAKHYGVTPGDQIFRPYRIEAVRIGIQTSVNPPVKGTLWIDKVRFYRE